MKLKDIKITMLGTTGAGKTSYLLGMYAAMQSGIQGFTLSARDIDLDLELTERWEQLISVRGADRWPPPNAGVIEHCHFDFNHGFRPIISFEWLDYRGLALSDRSGEQDVRELSQYLVESECVFLTISGEYLQEQVTPTTVREVKSDRMNQFLQRYISNNYHPTSDHPFPVAILITKYDLCHHRAKEEVIEDIKKLFQALFTANSGWLVMICPVSLGKELESDTDNGMIVPVNVHLPIIFAVYSQLRTYGINLKHQYSSLTETIKKNQQLNPIIRWLKRVETQKQLSKLEKSKEEIDTVENNMNLLAKELQQVSLFLDGNEVTADV
jgi:GTPase SAR1 family protein